MSRIDDIFSAQRASGARGLMPFVCAGYPTLQASIDSLEGIERAGGSIVEIGIPFSDPIADGPVIAGAMHEALEAGVTIAKIFEAVASVRSTLDIGLIAMGSVSIMHRIGIEKYIGMAKDAGFDGFILPDAPLNEAGPIIKLAQEADMAAALLVAPTTPDERAAEIAKACKGFVYLLSRSGITGAEGGGPGAALAGRCKAIRAATDTPIACGFGIASAEQVGEVVEHADAAIVGSALVKKMGAAGDAGAAAEAERFTKTLAEGLVVSAE